MEVAAGGHQSWAESAFSILGGEGVPAPPTVGALSGLGSRQGSNSDYREAKAEGPARCCWLLTIGASSGFSSGVAWAMHPSASGCLC